jgi:hypothetical protein
MSITQQLITLIRNKAVSDSDLQRAAFFTLNAIANTLAGRNSEPGRKLLTWATSQGASRILSAAPRIGKYLY